MGRRRSEYRGLVGKCEKRDHLKDLGVDGRISNGSSGKRKAVGPGFVWLRIG